MTKLVFDFYNERLFAGTKTGVILIWDLKKLDGE